jgi:hypothetical protein
MSFGCPKVISQSDAYKAHPQDASDERRKAFQERRDRERQELVRKAGDQKEPPS